MHASEQGDFITARLLLDALNRGGRAPPRWEQAAAMTKCSGCGGKGSRGGEGEGGGGTEGEGGSGIGGGDGGEGDGIASRCAWGTWNRIPGR
jgi:hypothetical protein